MQIITSSLDVATGAVSAAIVCDDGESQDIAIDAASLHLLGIVGEHGYGRRDARMLSITVFPASMAGYLVTRNFTLTNLGQPKLPTEEPV